MQVNSYVTLYIKSIPVWFKGANYTTLGDNSGGYEDKKYTS